MDNIKKVLVFVLICMSISGHSQNNAKPWYWIHLKDSLHAPAIICDSIMMGGTWHKGLVSLTQMMDSINNHSGGTVYANNGLYKDGDTVKLGDSAEIADSCYLPLRTSDGALHGYITGYAGELFFNSSFQRASLNQLLNPDVTNQIKYLRGWSDTSTIKMGYLAGRINSGIYNFFALRNAGYSNSNGRDNIFIGYNAGYSNTIGKQNIFIGLGAGQNVTTGSNNICLGVLSGDNFDTLSNRLYISSVNHYYDSTYAIIYGYQSSLIYNQRLYLNANTTITGNLITTGDLKYKFRHAVASADSVNFITGSTRFIYYKINAGLSVHDTLGITILGDSAKLQVAGDYRISAWIAASTSNASDQLRCKLYINNGSAPTSLGRFLLNSQGTGNAMTESFMWYLHNATANTYLSWRITNLTANRAITITDFKIYIDKVPE